MNCTNCNNPIPEERLEALPNTKTCVSCSSVQKKAVVEIATGKDCEIQFVELETAKKVQALQNNFLGY
jgi:Zn finger protein HypA/HybF involved in hydrogenase expression